MSTKTWTRAFIATLFIIISKNDNNTKIHQQEDGKQFVLYSSDKIHSAIKRNELLIYATTWTNLETIMKSGRS